MGTTSPNPWVGLRPKAGSCRSNGDFVPKPLPGGYRPRDPHIPVCDGPPIGGPTPFPPPAATLGPRPSR